MYKNSRLMWLFALWKISIESLARQQWLAVVYIVKILDWIIEGKKCSLLSDIIIEQYRIQKEIIKKQKGDKVYYFIAMVQNNQVNI